MIDAIPGPEETLGAIPALGWLAILALATTRLAGLVAKGDASA